MFHAQCLNALQKIWILEADRASLSPSAVEAGCQPTMAAAEFRENCKCESWALKIKRKIYTCTM